MVNQLVEKRRFGRRRSDIRGAAIVAKDQPKPFMIHDLSEGGALLEFDDKNFIPERSFRVLIDGTTMILLCEIRHRTRNGVGVRFMRPAEGAELHRYFQTKPTEVSKGHAPELQRRPAPTAAAVRGQDLRARLHLVHPAAEVADDPAVVHDRSTGRSALASGLTRFRNVFVGTRALPQHDIEAEPVAIDGDVPRR